MFETNDQGRREGGTEGGTEGRTKRVIEMLSHLKIGRNLTIIRGSILSSSVTYMYVFVTGLCQSFCPKKN